LPAVTGKGEKMYELQLKQAGASQWISAGGRSGSIGDLKDFADAQNTDYRIVDESGAVVWSFFARGKR
jgi:hypothetical protein